MEILLLILKILWEVFSFLCIIFTVTAFTGGFSKAAERVKEEREAAEINAVPEVPILLRDSIQQVYIENNNDRYMMYEVGTNKYIEQGKSHNDLQEKVEERFPDTTFILFEQTEE